MSKILTMHEVARMAFSQEIWDSDCKTFHTDISSLLDCLNIEDDLATCIVEMYAPIVDKLGLVAKAKSFDYDVETDFVYLRLLDDSEVLLPIDEDVIDDYTWKERNAATASRPLLEYYDREKLKKNLLSWRRRDFETFFKTFPREDKFDHDPKRLTKEKKRYYQSLKKLNPGEGVQTEHHWSLSEEERIAEDLFNLGFHSIQFMGLVDLTGFLCRWDEDALSDYVYQLYALGKDGKETELNLGDLETDEDKERKMDIDALLYQNDGMSRKKVVSQIVEEESKKFFAFQVCLFQTDR